MNTATKDMPAVERRKPGRPKGSGPKISGGTTDARQIAAAILEVLAGARLPMDAAAALSVSLPRYYALESRALEGLVKACEPRPKGRQRRPEGEIASLSKEVEQLKRDVQRQQALLRAAQRTIGLSEIARVKVAAGRKRRKRRPTVRALRAVTVLRAAHPETTPSASPETAPASP
jgi:hypothetical protein